MTAELKRKWLERLRSGRVRKCRRVYGRGDSMCALGVLEQIDAPALRRLLNCNPAVLEPIAKLNDRTPGFTAVADWIEANVRTEG